MSLLSTPLPNGRSMPLKPPGILTKYLFLNPQEISENCEKPRGFCQVEPQSLENPPARVNLRYIRGETTGCRPPPLLRVAKPGRNHLNEEITPPFSRLGSAKNIAKPY
jgi:hypothetical protein